MVLYDQIAGDAGYTMDPNLKSPTSRHFNIVLDREIIQDIGVGLSFVYKKEDDLIGLIDQGMKGQPGPEYVQVRNSGNIILG